MDHKTALQLRAAERYLLGEFTPDEREAFEEHFFECVECADDVRAGSALRANARAVFRDARDPIGAETEGLGWRDLFTWRPALVSLAANAILVIGLSAVLWQATGLRARLDDANAPRFYPSFGLAQSSRGARELDLPAGSRFFGATFDLLPGQEFDSFAYQIQDDSGTAVAQGSARAPANAGPERTLSVPVSMLKPGRYLFVLSGIKGGPPAEISRAHLITH
jgi:anti-sigma factor RsiW